MKKLYYYYAEWCQPCKALSPTLDKISQLIPVEKINIDYETTRVKSANVSSVPTVILTENGKELRRFTGNKSGKDILDFIK